MGGVNLYGYCQNNPTNWEDLLGLLRAKPSEFNTQKTESGGFLSSESAGQATLMQSSGAMSGIPVTPCGDPVPDPIDHCTSSEKLRAARICQSEGKSGLIQCHVVYSIPGFLRIIQFECVEDLPIIL